MKRLSCLACVLLLVACSGEDSTEDDFDSMTEQSLEAGTYNLVSVLSGRCLSVQGNNSANRTNIRTWTCDVPGAQRFAIEYLDSGAREPNRVGIQWPRGAARIRHVSSGKCVDIDGARTENGTNVQLYDCNGTAAQTWGFEPLGDGRYIVYSHLWRGPGKRGGVLDVAYAGTANGTNVHFWETNGSDAQKWRLQRR